MFYFNTVRLQTFTLSNSIVSSASADEDGGVIYAAQMQGEVQVLKCDINNFYVDNNHLGSFFYSATDTQTKFTLWDSKIACESFYISTDADNSILNS